MALMSFMKTNYMKGNPVNYLLCIWNFRSKAVSGLDGMFVLRKLVIRLDRIRMFCILETFDHGLLWLANLKIHPLYFRHQCSL